MDSLDLFSPTETQGRALCGFCDGKRQCYFYPTVNAPHPVWVNCPACEGRGWLPPTPPREIIQRILAAIRIDALAVRQHEMNILDPIESPPDTPFEEWSAGVEALLAEVRQRRESH